MYQCVRRQSTYYLRKLFHHTPFINHSKDLLFNEYSSLYHFSRLVLPNSNDVAYIVNAILIFKERPTKVTRHCFVIILRETIEKHLMQKEFKERHSQNIFFFVFFFSRKKATASVLVPGGALEALNLNTDETQIRLILNRRKGFIKLALKHGVDLVPTFSFGENFIYDQTKTDTGNLKLIHRLLVFFVKSL